MGRIVLFRSIALATTALVAGLPALAEAQTSPQSEALAALEQARKAREDARLALEEADKALKKAEALLAGSGPASTAQNDTPPHGLGLGTAPPSPPVPVSSAAPFCDGQTEASVARRMLAVKGQDDPRVMQDGTAASDLSGQSKVTVDGLNWFAYQCLRLNNYRDYKNITSLNLNATAASSDGIIEAGIGRTWRWLKVSGADTSSPVSTSYLSIRPAIRVNAGKATQAVLFDLDKFQFADGIGIKLGVEFGRSASKTRGTVEGDINAALGKARANCIAARGVRDPWAKPVGGETPPTQLSLRSGNDVLQQCSGDNLLEWLRTDKSASWESIVKPVWGYGINPMLFGGVEASWAWSDLSYYPLRDTNSGEPTGIPLPADFLTGNKSATILKSRPYALLGYLGHTWPLKFSFPDGDDGSGSFGLIGSATYRRSYEFPKSVKDQTVCVAAAASAFDQCRAVNIAAPVTREGFVLATAFKLELPRMAFLPPIGITFRPSYAFDIGQAGVEVPIFLLTDSQGKLNSGIKLTCTDDARTKSGFEVPGECGAALFFGSTFSLSGAP